MEQFIEAGQKLTSSEKAAVKKITIYLGKEGEDVYGKMEEAERIFLSVKKNKKGKSAVGILDKMRGRVNENSVKNN